MTMRHKNILLPLLLALALLLGTGPAAAAAPRRPELFCSQSREDGVLALALEGLDGSGVYGAQVELTLSGEYPDCTFTPYGAGSYSPDCRAAVSRGQTQVTIYLTSSSPLNNRDVLELGTLDLRGAAAEGLLPQSARMTLLDRGLAALPGTMSGAVPVSGAIRESGGTTAPEKPAAPGSSDGVPNPGTVVLPFLDVGQRDWFYDAVRFVYARGMMSGTDPHTFSPNQTTTRGMIVTILHRLEGSPAAAGTAFRDVPAAMYYAQPIAWASANGIVTGFGDGTFQPESPITREQLAAILMRYTRYKGLDVSARAGLEAFPDRDRISPYAQDAMAWSVSAGLIGGMDGLLAPAGSATRAQAATILMRLCTSVVKLS